MSSEQTERGNKAYEAGKMAFERGDYRQSVSQLETAAALVEPQTRLGGEVQIWLVTAYEAAGQRTQALELCRHIRRHPHWETRQQSKQLLYILEAPQLVRPAEWLTQIPDLSQLDDSKTPSFAAKPQPSSTKTSKPKKFEPEQVDLSQVKTQDNTFIWIALGLVGIIFGSVYWLS